MEGGEGKNKKWGRDDEKNKRGEERGRI